MAVEFCSVSFQLCPREANLVANELATPFCNEWMEDAPSELLPLLIKDVNLVTSYKEEILLYKIHQLVQSTPER